MQFMQACRKDTQVQILPGVPQNMIKGMNIQMSSPFLLFKYSIFAK
jgi:hypothetical protein